jgi:deoxyribodipyrimidine photo-lyase
MQTKSNIRQDTTMELHTDFSNRQEITEYLADKLSGLYTGDPIAPTLEGGRKPALERLHNFRAKHYGRRNHTDAPVSQLSAYLRHGMLEITEVANHIRQVANGRERDEFLKQLTWREFFNLVLEQEGEAVFANLEPPKYAAKWQKDLPQDLEQGDTGLPCVDAWVQKLVETGYLHNHERLWFAAYTVHFRKTDWKAGFLFFRQHLLDGDIASNALSWQWVASTFSSKPYYMNQENIQKFSSNQWCAACTARCPFDKSYAQLEQTLFGGNYGWAQ